MFNSHTRRKFLKAISAVGVAGMLPTAGCAQTAVSAPVAILRRPIPGTGEMLPVIGFGSTAGVRMIVQEGPALITELLDTMLGMGASVVDTAPREIEVDEAFGKVLSEPRFKDNLFVTTKIGLNRFRDVREVDKQGGIDQYEQTRRLFKRQPADLIQIESMTDMHIHWPTLLDWKNSGEARYIGITSSATVDHARMEAFMKSDRPDFIQVNYSLLEPEAGSRVLPMARDLGIAVLINSPFDGGAYFKQVSGQQLPEWGAEFDCETWAQFNLKYILGETAVNCVLTETTRVVNLQDNLRAGTGRLPDAEMRNRMQSHFAAIARKEI